MQSFSYRINVARENNDYVVYLTRDLCLSEPLKYAPDGYLSIEDYRTQEYGAGFALGIAFWIAALIGALVGTCLVLWILV
jgi:hypothetical protein